MSQGRLDAETRGAIDAGGTEAHEAVVVGGETVTPGTRRRIELPVATLPTGTSLSIPVLVIHGAGRGPSISLSATIHGDELNGVEIIRRVCDAVDETALCGTVIAAPIVNVYGFLTESRYLPDRRDLNRAFPGSKRGSLASRLANLFMREIVAVCSHGVDFHTGSDHRINLPQLRGDLDDAEVRRCARAFAPPVIIHARSRDGSLREAATRQGMRMLLYEGGQAHRFDRAAIERGTEGTLRLMGALEMLPDFDVSPTQASLIARRTIWGRARRSGLCRMRATLGDRVEKGETIATIADAFGENAKPLRAPATGVVIGLNQSPFVSQGDAMVNVAVIGEGQGAVDGDAVSDAASAGGRADRSGENS